mgnify:CR=1 FL=1
MKLVTQAELARHLDLTRSRVHQLIKQGVFLIHDVEHGLLEKGYCVYCYEQYKLDNMGHVSRHQMDKEEKLESKLKSKLKGNLRWEMNSAFDAVLPTTLEVLKVDYELHDENLERASESIVMFYSKLLEAMTGEGLCTYVKENNPKEVRWFE